MRLLVVSQYFWPENFRINDLMIGLVDRGHEVTVLTGQPNYPEGHIYPAFRRDPATFAQFEGSPVVRVPVIPRGTGRLGLILNYLSFAASAALLGAWRLRGQRFDAIFVFQTSPITAALPAILLRRLKRAPLLLWVLDLWPETLQAVGVVRSRRVLGWIGRLVTFIYRRCDLILAQSQAFTPNILHWAGKSSQVRYFPGWAETLFGEGATPPAAELAPYRTTFNVVFAGNIGEAQDFPAILDAAERLRRSANIRWLIVGEGRAAASVRSEVERRSLQDCVKFLGRHPIERMPAFFAGAGALLVSLKDEPVFGMTIPGKVQTYLAAGVPILGMLNGEGARVIEESGAGFVCPAGDSLSLARRVEQLAALSPADRAAMGRRGRDYGEREFGRSALLDRLELCLNEAAIAVPR